MKSSSNLSAWMWLSAAAPFIGAKMLYPYHAQTFNNLLSLISVGMVIGILFYQFTGKRGWLAYWACFCVLGALMAFLKAHFAGSFDWRILVALVLYLAMPAGAWILWKKDKAKK